MVNWTKGLSDWQLEKLNELLAEEKKIPTKTYEILNKEGGIVETLTGRCLPKNKLVRGRDSGYTIYIDTKEGLRSFSAFSFNLKETT